MKGRRKYSRRPIRNVGTALALLLWATSASAQSPSDSVSESFPSRIGRALDRIAADEATFNAWITVDTSLRASKAADTSPLLLAIKDNIDVAGLPGTAGANILRNRIPAQDAFVVQRLKEGGAIVVGKTNLDTYARGVRSVSELGGSTGNAWNPKRSPGGSSGGTAVAVARGHVDAGLGTDTCGSSRYPAVYNGVYGLRPSSGLVSRSGVIPLAPSQDVVGPIARTPRQLAEILRIIAVPDPGDPMTMTVPRPPIDSAQLSDIGTVPRLGVLHGYGTFAKSSDGATVLDTLRQSGAVLVNVSLPQIPNANLIADEFAPALHSFLNQSAESWLRQPVRVEDRSGYKARQRTQATARNRLVETLERHKLDGLVYPTTQYPSAPRGAKQPSSNCYLAATTGLPAIALPHRLGPDGLPAIGADILGRPFSELRLLQIAAKYDTFAQLTFPVPTL